MTTQVAVDEETAPDRDTDTGPKTGLESESDTGGAARARWSRTVLLGVVLLCAACGLVYELALVTLGSYLLGNTATQASIVLSVMVFAMGVGSLLAKPLRRASAEWFIAIELILALLGGVSVLGLYLAFAFLSLYTPALVVTAFVLGALIGAEMPLLMELLQEIRKQRASDAVAELFATDYVGALIGGLAFPFLLLPFLGQIRGALVVGIVNALAAAIVAFVLLRNRLTRRTKTVVALATTLVVALLVTALATAGQIEASARQTLYRDPIVHSERSAYQDIVVTESRGTPNDVRLFLNGDLQFSSTDEYRYHESLVHPAMSGARGSVLVLGGGDGLALREVLRYPDVKNVTLVELDPAMIELASTMPEIRELNADAFTDPRVNVVNADAFTWLRTHEASYDAIIVDMPDPDQTETAKLYSVEFYTLVRAHLSPGGLATVQSGSPYFAPQSFWCISATLIESGLSVTPYQVDVPSFGNWGFHLVSTSGTPPVLSMDPPVKPRFLTDQLLASAVSFPADRPPLSMPYSTLIEPVILEYAQAEWVNY